MVIHRRIALLIVVSFLLISCSRPALRIDSSPPATSQNRSDKLTLVVEREIAGLVLGMPLRSPSGIAVDRNGRIYVSDKGNNRVILFDSSFKAIKQVGGYGSSDGQLNEPGYLTLDNDLSLLVADPGNRRVCRFTSQLEYISSIVHDDPNDPLLLGPPTGVAIQRNGEVWTSSETARLLSRFDLRGAFVQSFRGIELGGSEFFAPGKLTQQADGQFILCDPERPAVYTLAPEQEKVVDVFRPDHLRLPSAAVEWNEHLWIVDAGRGMVMQCSDRTVVREFGPNLPGTATAISLPHDFAAIDSDRFVLADTGNNRILIIRVYRDSTQSE